MGSGLVKICHLTADGKVSTIAYVKPGDKLFGEWLSSMLASAGEYVESVEACVLIRIPKQRIQELMNRDLNVALAVTNSSD